MAKKPDRPQFPTDHELLDVVDADNQVIGTATRRQVHELGLMHRSVHVFLVDEDGRLYLQRRAAGKETFPGAHDSSAAGHVNSGEDYESCVVREVEEELGLAPDHVELVDVGELPASEENGWEHVRFYLGRTTREPTPNPEEIEHGAYYTLAEVADLIDRPDTDFAPTFRILYTLYTDSLASMVANGEVFGR